MFREMQAALLFARGKEIRNNVLRGNSHYKTIPVRSREALEWTTINGAKAFRMDGQIGTLSPGKKADIVMLRADDVNMAPVYDPVYSIVEIAGAGNVDTVIIDGVVRKKDGKLTFPADVLRKRRDELSASGERIMREGGYQVRRRRNDASKANGGNNGQEGDPPHSARRTFCSGNGARSRSAVRASHHPDARLHARRERRHHGAYRR